MTEQTRTQIADECAALIDALGYAAGIVGEIPDGTGVGPVLDWMRVRDELQRADQILLSLRALVDEDAPTMDATDEAERRLESQGFRL